MNLIRHSHELDLRFLHQHATEEEDFGGSHSVHVTSATVGTNGGGMDAGGRTDVDEEAHNAAKSKGKAAHTSTSVIVPCPSQEA